MKSLIRKILKESDDLGWAKDLGTPKIYTVVGKGLFDSDSRTYHLGTVTKLETAVKRWGIDEWFIIKQWGSIEEYVKWVKSPSNKQKFVENGKDVYIIPADKAKKDGVLPEMYYLYVYETDLEFE